MDAHDTQVQAELERRTAVITHEEAGDRVHVRLPVADLVWMVAIVAAAVVGGLVAAL